MSEASAIMQASYSGSNTLEDRQKFADIGLQRQAGEFSIDDALGVGNRVADLVQRFTPIGIDGDRVRLQQTQAEADLERARTERATAVTPTQAGGMDWSTVAIVGGVVGLGAVLYFVATKKG